MTFQDILNQFQQAYSQAAKGAAFERLMQAYLQTEPMYCERFSDVWLWQDFPSKQDFGGHDIGIDIVCKTHEGDYWAVQCKCYQDGTIIDKAAVDSFLATSSKTFKDAQTFEKKTFAHRLWIDTASKWNSNAEIAIENQSPAVSRITKYFLDKSAIEWIMDRYRVKKDEKSGITNDANDWAREHNDPTYILDLLLSIIYVSQESNRIVNSLPKLVF